MRLDTDVTSRMLTSMIICVTVNISPDSTLTENQCQFELNSNKHNTYIIAIEPLYVFCIIDLDFNKALTL